MRSLKRLKVLSSTFNHLCSLILKVREALTYAMDFEWMNKNMFYGQYKRTRSYFQNTDYEAKGLPSEAEVELLSQYKDQIPPRVFHRRIPTARHRWQRPYS